MGQTDRVVVLIDMDCFYCQVEEKLNPDLRGQPIAVVQHNEWRGGGIIAVNYPARDQGVTRHMRGDDAKQKCPSITLVKVPQVRGKADLTKYRDAGKEVADVLATFTPLLERASVDEAYLDITESVKNRMEANSFDLSLENLKNTFVVGNDLKDYLNNAITNREFADNNLKLAVGALITEEIRQEVYTKTGYRCSAGVAHNKILAKLVCSLHKPNKQTILPNDAVDKFFETMPINKIKSLGGKFGQTLSDDLQITYMGQLKKFTEKELTQKYDEKTASWLYNIARGIDLEPVTTKLISKSIACCKTFQGKNALTTLESVQHWLNELADELLERLEKDLKENNRRAKQMIVSFVHEVNKKDVNSTRTHPLISYNKKKIGRHALEVINKFCLKTDGSYHIKFLGLSASHFEDVKNVREITSFFKTGQDITNENNSFTTQLKKTVPEQANINIADENVDLINSNAESDPYLHSTQELQENVDDLMFYDDTFRIKNEPGLIQDSVTPSTSKCEISEKKDSLLNTSSSNWSLSSFFKQYFDQGKVGNSSTKHKQSNLEESKNDIEEKSFDEESSVVCSECGKRIPQFEYLSHQDYHFAMKLSENDQTNTHTSTSSVNKAPDRKRNASKISGNKATNNMSLLSFFNTGEEDSSDLTETCLECNKKIKLEDVDSHRDYHVAKKIHLELNASTSVERNNTSKMNTKNKPPKNNQNLMTFFKQA